MFNFKLFHKPSLPAFPALAAYERKNQYFGRVAAWHWLTNEQIVVIDPHAPRIITMDAWPQLVFLDATGKLTVAGYVDYMAHRYRGQTPEKLDATIIEELEGLVSEKMVVFSDTPLVLQPAHDLPRSAKG